AVRLSIAQVLTVISHKQRAALREAYEKKKYLSLDLRPKKTRAIRRRLIKHQIEILEVQEVIGFGLAVLWCSPHWGQRAISNYDLFPPPAPKHAQSWVGTLG
ncbi:hypothetical protein Ancab_004395, partial [Ancistrocladus abbreviatus]